MYYYEWRKGGKAMHLWCIEMCDETCSKYNPFSIKILTTVHPNQIMAVRKFIKKNREKKNFYLGFVFRFFKY